MFYLFNANLIFILFILCLIATAIMNMSSAPNTSLSNFCCVHEVFKSIHKIESFGHLTNSTEFCMVSKQELLKYVNMIVNDRMPPAYMNCAKYKDPAHHLDPCNQSTERQYIALLVFWFIVMIVGLLGNLTVIVAVFKFRFLNSVPTNYFIASLAVTDLLVFLLVVPSNMIRAYYNTAFCAGKILCRTFMTLDFTLFTASIAHLFVISLDRLTAVMKPYTYRSILNAGRAKVIIACIWCYAVLLGALGNVRWENQRSEDQLKYDTIDCGVSSRYYVTIIFVLAFDIPAVIMAIIYILIVAVVARHAKQSPSQKKTPSENISLRNNSSLNENTMQTVTTNCQDVIPMKSISEAPKKTTCKAKKAHCKRSRTDKMMITITKTALTVYSFFILCWLPANVIILNGLWSPLDLNVNTKKWIKAIFIQVLPVINSTGNPFIYAFMSDIYRRAFKKLVGKIF